VWVQEAMDSKDEKTRVKAVKYTKKMVGLQGYGENSKKESVIEALVESLQGEVKKDWVRMNHQISCFFAKNTARNSSPVFAALSFSILASSPNIFATPAKP